MSRIFKVLTALSLSLASAAMAAPESLQSPTKTGLSDTDLKRIATLAESIDALSGKLALNLFIMQPEACMLAKPCSTVGSEIVVPLRDAARDLAMLARSHTGASVSNEFVKTLRVEFFDKIALSQHELHRAFATQGRSGSTPADLACQDLLDVYNVLLYQLVAKPREFGGTEGRGQD